jgi:hypothetical protein
MPFGSPASPHRSRLENTDKSACQVRKWTQRQRKDTATDCTEFDPNLRGPPAWFCCFVHRCGLFAAASCAQRSLERLEPIRLPEGSTGAVGNMRWRFKATTTMGARETNAALVGEDERYSRGCEFT